MVERNQLQDAADRGRLDLLQVMSSEQWTDRNGFEVGML